MPDDNSVQWLELADGRVGVDPHSGGLSSVSLTEPATEFIGGPVTSGLLRMAVPVDEYPSHYLELGTHGAPDVQADADRIRLVCDELVSDYCRLAVHVQIDLTRSPDGVVVRARVENNSDVVIPQVVFPQLLGLDAVGGTADTRLQFGRGRIVPFEELTMRVDDAWWLERPLQEYVHYGMSPRGFNMKWLDYGDAERGMTLYARSPRHTTQGLVLDRVDRVTERLDLRWAHYPFIAPGETWDSDDFVLLPHSGDWYAGARAYKKYADEKYPYRAPRRIREALGVRSVWPAVRNAPPTFQLTELPAYAAEVADPDLGLAELVVWHWWLKNGYPIIFDERLGTEDEFADAIAKCTELGVPVSLFVSHHILRDSDETDPSWLHHNPAGQTQHNNWTYGPDLLPRFRAHFLGTHAMVRGSALSPGWRQTGLDEYRRILKYGATSICFDVFTAGPEPNFSPAIDGRPDEEGDKLIEFAEEARQIIHNVNPDGSFSGEGVTDLNVPVLDYTWEWRSGYHMADSGPFRYVFPQFRLNANVGSHPRGAILAFMDDAFLNLIPGDMRSHRLADHPDLVACVRQLAALRRRFLHYFTEGQYRFVEGLELTGCEGRLYTHGDDVLVIVTNPSDERTTATVRVDPTVWDGAARFNDAAVYNLDGTREFVTALEPAGTVGPLILQPDDLNIIEYTHATGTS